MYIQSKLAAEETHTYNIPGTYIKFACYIFLKWGIWVHVCKSPFLKHFPFYAVCLWWLSCYNPGNNIIDKISCDKQHMKRVICAGFCQSLLSAWNINYKTYCFNFLLFNYCFIWLIFVAYYGPFSWKSIPK